MSEAKMITLERAKVEAVFVFVGWQSPDKWTNDRMAGKIPAIKDVLPETKPENEDVANTLLQILAGIEEGATFEVVGGVPAPAAATNGAAAPAEKSEEEKKKEAEAKAKKEADAAAKKAAAEAKKKAAADAKAARDAAKKPGVRPSYTASYIAGVVIKKYGLQVGITPAMVDEYDQLRGRDNKPEAQMALALAWHIVNGYTGEIPVEVVDKTKKAEQAPAPVAADPAPAAPVAPVADPVPAAPVADVAPVAAAETPAVPAVAADPVPVAEQSAESVQNQPVEAAAAS